MDQGYDTYTKYDLSPYRGSRVSENTTFQLENRQERRRKNRL